MNAQGKTVQDCTTRCLQQRNYKNCRFRGSCKQSVFARAFSSFRLIFIIRFIMRLPCKQIEANRKCAKKAARKQGNRFLQERSISVFYAARIVGEPQAATGLNERKRVREAAGATA